MLTGISDLVVYLVEPSQLQSRVISTMLGEHGVRHIERFESAAAMFAQLRAQPPSLVISALYLPDMAGTGLVARLRADPATEHTPFILIQVKHDRRCLIPCASQVPVAFCRSLLPRRN